MLDRTLALFLHFSFSWNCKSDSTEIKFWISFFKFYVIFSVKKAFSFYLILDKAYQSVFFIIFRWVSITHLFHNLRTNSNASASNLYNELILFSLNALSSLFMTICYPMSQQMVDEPRRVPFKACGNSVKKFVEDSITWYIIQFSFQYYIILGKYPVIKYFFQK